MFSLSVSLQIKKSQLCVDVLGGLQGPGGVGVNLREQDIAPSLGSLALGLGADRVMVADTEVFDGSCSPPFPLTRTLTDVDQCHMLTNPVQFCSWSLNTVMGVE